MKRRVFAVLIGAATLGCASYSGRETDISDAAGPLVFELKTDRRGECYWILKSSNGETIAKSSESYEKRKTCDRSIELVRQASDAKVVEGGQQKP